MLTTKGYETWRVKSKRETRISLLPGQMMTACNQIQTSDSSVHFYDSVFKNYKHVVTQRAKQQLHSEQEPGNKRKQRKYTCRSVML